MIESTEYKSYAFSSCRFCHGRGCLYCPAESSKPQPIAAVQAPVQPKPEPEYWYRSSLLKRGWNDQLIAELLGPHDKETKNPHYRSGPPSRLYLRSRVEEAEQSEAFQSKQLGREERSAAAQRAVETKRANLKSFLDSLKIDIPLMNDDELIKLAVRNRNARVPDWKLEEGEAELVRVESISLWPSADSFRDRICVNYLRHELSNYDSVLRRLSRRVGKKEGHRILREKVYAAIGERYPHLKIECERQMEERKRECES